MDCIQHETLGKFMLSMKQVQRLLGLVSSRHLGSDAVLSKDQDYVKTSFIPIGDNDFLPGWQMFSFPMKSYRTKVK